MHINYWGLAGMVVIILAIIGCYIAAFDIEKHIDIFRIPCRKAPNDIRLTENGANIQLAVPAKPGDPFLTTQVIKLNREDGSHCTVTVIVRDDRYRPKPKAVTPGKLPARFRCYCRRPWKATPELQYQVCLLTPCGARSLTKSRSCADSSVELERQLKLFGVRTHDFNFLNFLGVHHHQDSLVPPTISGVDDIIYTVLG